MNFIAIDIGGTNIRSSIVSDDGKITNLIKNKSSPNITSDINQNIIQQINYSKKESLFLKGIGISIGGIVDNQGNIISVDNNSKWKCIDLKKEICLRNLNFNELMNNITIDNDGNCSAHCEKKFGNAKNCENFITIVLGTGVGIGIYINNKIIQHSEFGFLVEEKCSGKYFDSIQENRESTILKGAIFLGKKTAELCNIICPEKVIFSGPLLKITEDFKNEIEKSIFENLILKNVEIVFSNIENQGLLGSIFNLVNKKHK